MRANAREVVGAVAQQAKTAVTVATDVASVASGIGSIRNANAQQADTVGELTAAFTSLLADERRPRAVDRAGMSPAAGHDRVCSPEELRRIEHVDRLLAGGGDGLPGCWRCSTTRAGRCGARWSRRWRRAGDAGGRAAVSTCLRTQRDDEARIAATVDALSALTGDVRRRAGRR